LVGGRLAIAGRWRLNDKTSSRRDVGASDVPKTYTSKVRFPARGPAQHSVALI